MSIIRKPGFTLSILLFAAILAFIDRQLLNILVRPIQADTGLDDVQFSVLQGAAFGLVYSFAAFPVAYLADRYGPKKIIIGSVVAWSFMTLLFGIAESFTALLIARMGLAIGEAGLSPAAISIARRIYPTEKQAFAVAILTTSVYLGGGLSMIVGGPAFGFLTAHSSEIPFAFAPWRTLFAACAILGAVAFALLLLIPDYRFPRVEGNKSSLAEFARLAKKQRATVGSYLAAFIGIHALVVAVMSWMPAMFIRTYGWSEERVGLAYGTVFTLCGIVGALGGGRLVGGLVKSGNSGATITVARGAMILLGAGSIAAAAAPNGTIALVFSGFAMLGVGSLLALGAFGLQAYFPPEFSARASAVYFLVPGTLGASFGPTAVALLGNAAGDMAVAIAIFSVITMVWSVVWLSYLRRIESSGRNVYSS